METKSPTSKIFFLKVILSNAFIVGGRPVPFEPVPGNEGVIALDPKTDSDLINSLSNAAANQKGGIVRISEEEYTQKKTARDLRRSVPRSRDALRPMPSAPSPFNTQTTAQKAAPPVSAAAPAKATVTTPKVEPAAPVAPQTALTEAAPAAAPQAPAEELTFRPTTRRISRKDSIPAD